MIRWFRLRRLHKAELELVHQEIGELNQSAETLKQRISRLEQDSSLFRQRARELTRTD